MSDRSRSEDREIRQGGKAESTGGRRVLLVQSCHPPIWLYFWELLERLRPEWEIEGLAADHPDVRFFAEFAGRADRVHFVGDVPEVEPWDACVVPTVGPGYRKLRREAARLTKGPILSVDYTGDLRPMSKWELAASTFRRAQPPPHDAEIFFRRLPPFAVSPRVLVAETVPQEQKPLVDEVLERLIPPGREVVRVEPVAKPSEGFRLPENCEVGIVFLTGERGFLDLKLWALRLPLRRLIVVDESGGTFEAKPLALMRFVLRRMLGRRRPPRWGVRILVWQTEAAPYVAAALERLSRPYLFRRPRVLLVCREEDREALAGHVSVAETITFSKNMSYAALWSAWRGIHRFRPHVNAAVWTGRPVFRKQKLAFFVCGPFRRLVFNAALDAYWLTWRSWPRLFRREPLLFGWDKAGSAEPVKILVVQTEEAGYVAEAVKRLRSPKLFPNSQIYVFCRREDRVRLKDLPGVVLTIPFPRRKSWKSWWRLGKYMRRRRFQVKTALFCGRKIFLPAKAFFLVRLIGRPALVFNAALDAYWLTWRSWPRLFRREPLLFGWDKAGSAEPVKILVVQTEEAGYVAEAVKRLRSPKLFPNSQIYVFCRREDRVRLKDLPGVVLTIPFPRRKSWKSWWRLGKYMRRRRFQVKTALFCGRKIFLPAKAFFLVRLIGRPALVFNAALDAYWLTWRSWPRLFRREPLLWQGSRDETQRVLLLETERPERMAAAAEILHRPHVVPSPRVVLLCRSDRADSFRSCEYIAEVVPYGRGLKADLQLMFSLIRRRPDIVAAVFSGTSIFLKQKVLFWMLPAGARLAFNRHLDCRYVSRLRPGFTLHREISGGLRSAVRFVLLRLVRGLLFLPRFIYLLAWYAWTSPRRKRTDFTVGFPGVG